MINDWDLTQIDRIKPGGLRILRTGEIILATTLYGNSIHYNKV